MRAVERAIARLLSATRDLPGDISAEHAGDRVRLQGRGLLRRWAEDPRLHLLTASAERRRR
jgi:hypothetical protein